jgi:hypothetical protein
VQQKSVSPQSGPLGAQSKNPIGGGDSSPRQTQACVPVPPEHNVESVDAHEGSLVLVGEPTHVLVPLSHWSPSSQYVLHPLS